MRVRLKTLFFDEPAVIRAVDKAKRRVLSKAGAFVYRKARDLVKKRKGSSDPGDPPHGHGPQTLKKGIFFSYDLSTKSVVVGPVLLPRVFYDGDGKPIRGTIPEVLETGGKIRILEVYRDGKWARADLRETKRNAGLPTRLRAVEIADRPFMSTAEKIERERHAELWRNSVY